jgi:hypothetical protein
MKSLFRESKKSTLGFLLKALDKDKSNFFLTGLLNIESGDISVRTRRYNENTDSADEFRECVDCSSYEVDRVFFVDCKSCGKSKNNYFWLKSGDGDGVYATFQILRLDESTGEGFAFGFATVFVPTDVFAQPLVEVALENALDLDEPLSAFGFTANLLEEFGDLEAFEVTSFNLENGNSVFLADKDALVDTSNSIIGMNMDHPDDTELSFLAFSEAIGSQSGAYPNDISPRPRVLIGLDSAWLATQGFQATMQRPDSSEVFQDWIMTGIQSCHIEPMANVSTWFNFKINEAMEKYNYAASWLLQGAIHGDKDCIKEISRYEEFLSDPEWIKTWLEQRFQYLAVMDFEKSNKLPFNFAAKKTPDADSSEKVGGPNWGENQQITQMNKSDDSPMFCTECGRKSMGGKFCGYCGSPLNLASGEFDNEDDTEEIEEVPQIRIDSFLLAGYFTVDSGQAMVGDPAYLDDWDTNENDEWNLDGKEGQYSYHGATAITVPNSYGELGHAKAVVFSTGRGDGMYPVYVEIDEDDKVSKVLIDFMGDIEL